MTPVVDLWMATLPRPLPERLSAACAAVLTPDERAAAGRFRDAHRRDQALVGRALLRRALAHRFGPEAERWELRPGANGRPEAPDAPAGSDFNLAHCDGCVVCAVAEVARVGVDVEPLARAGQIRAVAARVLAPAEAAALAALPPAEQALRLVRLWTLKEAWAKARGDGLANDFRTIVVVADPGRPERFRLPDAPEWQLEAFAAGTEHAGALAVRCRGQARTVPRDAAALLGA